AGGAVVAAGEGLGVTTKARGGVDSLGAGRRSGVSVGVDRGVRSGVSSGSGVGFGTGDFFFFAGGCVAGFGLWRGVADASGVGDATVRIFSRDLRKSCFFSSSVNSARVIVPARPTTSSSAQRRNWQRMMTRGRIKARATLGGLRLGIGGVLGAGRGAFAFALQDGV